MKTILCYGDSLTYGTDAETQGRHRFEDRWPSVLEAGLSGQVRVIAEGLGGRTTVFDDSFTPADLNGARILPTLIKTHAPLDCVIIMLGTNDLKPFVSGSAVASAWGMNRLVEIVQNYPYGAGATVPEVIMVAPPHCAATDHVDLEPLFEGAIEQSRLFGSHYARIAEQAGCGFFDAASVAKATPIDGVHLDGANTRAIGTALVPVVSRLLGL
jgi:lysophospholipase L1-like esterase